MNIRSIKRLAASILDVGVNRVRINNSEENAERLKNAITRADIKALIKDKVIYVLPKKIRRKKIMKPKKGPGKRKGKKYSRKSKKEIWMEKIRALRKYLNELIENNTLDRKYKRELYLKIKGGHFKGKTAFLNYLKDNEYIEVKENA